MELLVKEACNAALTALRRGLIKKDAFNRVIETTIRLSSINVRMFPQAELMRDAVRIASYSRLTVYDSLYLSLARNLKAPLLSLDARQAEAARKMSLKVIKR